MADKPVGIARINVQARTAADSITERRRAPRAAVELTVRLNVASPQAAVSSRTVNISRTGVFIATRLPPPVGTVLDLEIVQADGKLLFHGRAEVVRHHVDVEPKGVGAKFLDVSYECQELIDVLVNCRDEPT